MPVDTGILPEKGDILRAKRPFLFMVVLCPE